MSGQETIKDMVNERVIAGLERGVVPWHQPWSSTAAPMSMSSDKPYRGSNVFILLLTAMAEGYTSAWWGTYDQIAEQSGMTVSKTIGRRKVWESPDGQARGVRKGETSTPVVYFRRWSRPDPDAAPLPDGSQPLKSGVTMFYNNVFSADQADGLPERYYPQPGAEIERIDTAENVIKGYLGRDGAPTLRKGTAAYYAPKADQLTLPDAADFEDMPYYYGTAYHEMTHSTGHASRLNRRGIAEFGHFGDQNYAKEELVAHMGSAILAVMTGTDLHFDEFHVSYIGNWLKALRGDNGLVVYAGAQAQRAVDHILGITYDNDGTEGN